MMRGILACELAQTSDWAHRLRRSWIRRRW